MGATSFPWSRPRAGAPDWPLQANTSDLDEVVNRTIATSVGRSPNDRARAPSCPRRTLGDRLGDGESE